jgi:hypothetical protein
VGRQYRVRAFAKRVVFWEWLGLEHVEAGSSDPTLIQGVGESVAIYQCASRCVDQQGIRLHHGQRRLSHNMMGLGGERCMERQYVRF